MAQQTTGKNSNNGQKRGPGRPPGSKNKPKTGTGTGSGRASQSSSGASYSGGPTKQEVIHEMQRRNDRDRRNNDIIWSITLFAIGLFLFFTVVMDTTGSFGMRVHDIFNGLFGIMAFVLPFFVFLFAILLLAGRLQHIGARTAIFSILIFINMCIINSYRFIDPENLHYGFSDMLDYFVAGIDGKQGGMVGMELGSLLVKFFGMPGLLIIAGAVILISVFLVANTPISRFADNLSRKNEHKKLLKQLEEDERRRISDAEIERAFAGELPDRPVTASVPAQTASQAPANRSFLRSLADKILGDGSDESDAAKDVQMPEVPDFVQGNAASASDIPEPFSRRGASDAGAARNGGSASGSPADNIEYTQIMPSPMGAPAVEQKLSRDTLFGRLKNYITGTSKQTGAQDIGIDSETGETVSSGNIGSVRSSSSAQKSGPGRYGMDGSNTKGSSYSDDRNFESENADYGYPGRKRSKPLSDRQGYGLGDPDEIVHSGSYGLDAHGGSSGLSRAARGMADENATAASAAVNRRGFADAEGVQDSAASEAAKAAPGAAARRRASSKAGAAAPAAASLSAAEKEALAAKDLADDAEIAAGFSAQTDDSGYEFPPVSLLKKDTSSKQMVSDVQLEEKANLLEQTLNNFGVEATVLNVTQGASVTRYEVQPAVGVKVASITKLSNDIALNLRAKSIRIEAPIPGKAAVGIEVENDIPAPVLIRDLIESDEFRDAPSKISFVVGKDISGNNIVADLKGMPHMLIAGATGSGKSVCINSIVTSFLYKARPSELKLIMIDPKVVELGNYNGIPHMLTPVVTDPRKASRALAIAVEEMDKRYEAFAENNVRDLESYNELMRANHRYADCKPQIVIIIDELADLMMAAPKEVENSICRLAQKARAAGMHLIVATQRPSVDVVTGLIKANIPSRIAFSVASQVDSRTILDMAGAENLLGKGDMLFSPVGATKPYRVQGPYISDKEIEKVIKFVKKEGGAPAYDEAVRNAIESNEKKPGSEPQDELTEDAIAYIFKSKTASVSMLQRRFRIGYNRAARIIDEIEDKGIIGPSDGSKPRQLLMSEDEYYGRYDNTDVAEDAAPADIAEAAAETVQSPEAAEIPQNAQEPAQQAASAGIVQPVRTSDAADTGNASGYAKLSNTRAMDSFNSLPESVRRMVMDADSSDD